MGWSNSIMHASVGCACESIRPGKTILPPRSTRTVRGPRGFWTSSIGADADQTVALDGQGLADREIAIDRDDLAVMEDQVGLVFGSHGRTTQSE